MHSIEKESAKYNLRLNKQKCVVLNMNEIMRVEYSDGTQVPEKNQAVYLGAVIAEKSEYKPELNHRIAATARVTKSLNKLWLHAPVSTQMENPSIRCSLRREVNLRSRDATNYTRSLQET